MEKSPGREDGYFTVIGDSWAGAYGSAEKPFVGIRFEKDEGWSAI